MNEVNDLRAEQSALTRSRIMDALAAQILEEGVQGFSIQQVADRAGVSHRTVYRHFPSRQALLDALAEWLDARLEEKIGHAETGELVRDVELSFEAMDALSRHVTAYVMLTFGTRTTAARRRERTERFREVVRAGPARDLDDRGAAAVAGLVRSLVSSVTWFQMTQELALDGRTVGRVVAWALETLFAELARGGGPRFEERKRRGNDDDDPG